VGFSLSPLCQSGFVGSKLVAVDLASLGRGESSFTGSSGSGFAGSKQVAVDWASLVGGYYMISWKNNG